MTVNSRPEKADGPAGFLQAWDISEAG